MTAPDTQPAAAPDLENEPELGPGTDVVADPEHLDHEGVTLTTDPGQRKDDLDPNEGEEGSG